MITSEVLKTFDSDIDKISSKWGVFGRTFNEIGTAIVERVKDIKSAFQSTDSIFDTFKSSDSILKKLYPSKENIKSQLIDIDKIYPSKADSQFSSILSKLIKTNPELFMAVP